jgi:hypothetical protein
MTMDGDTDPAMRKSDPKFFGMIPDAPFKRNLCFAIMMINSALFLIIRCLGVAFLIQSGKAYYMWYTFADHALYWLYLLARNDGWVLLKVTGPLGVLASSIVRIVFKVAVDYTGLISFRISGCLGGMYWTINTVTAFITTFGAIYVFFEKHTEVDAGLKDAIWALVTSLSVFFAIGFCVFLCLINSKYIDTFYSTQTTWQLVQSFYLEGATDQEKYSKIVKYNPHCWKSIRPQVKADMLAKWERWETDKPAWFDDLFVAKVDDDMVPPQALARLKAKGGSERRRSSLGERMSLRVSAKERVGIATELDDDAVAVEEGVIAADEGEGFGAAVSKGVSG